MRKLRQFVTLSVIAGLSFGAAFAARVWSSPPPERLAPVPPPFNAPDSVHLAAMGIRPGRQLVAYVFVASRCGQCQRTETKDALRALPVRLREGVKEDYRSTSVIGVALDADIREGLQYLTTLGLATFDEISIGRASLNDHVAQWVWRTRIAEPAVPQVVLVARNFTATYPPLKVQYDPDSVIAVLAGRNAVVEWVRRGATIPDAVKLAAEAAKERDTTPADSASRSTKPTG